MSQSPLLCERCVQNGIETFADYVYESEETSLAGPMMGDPDYWPPSLGGQRSLCAGHYAQLPADVRLDYVTHEV